MVAALAVMMCVAPQVARASTVAGWWRMDETSGTVAADSSGHHNDGKLENIQLDSGANPATSTRSRSPAAVRHGVSSTALRMTTGSYSARVSRMERGIPSSARRRVRRFRARSTGTALRVPCPSARSRTMTRCRSGARPQGRKIFIAVSCGTSRSRSDNGRRFTERSIETRRADRRHRASDE